MTWGKKREGVNLANFLPVNLAIWPNRTKWRIFLRGVKVATAKLDKVANFVGGKIIKKNFVQGKKI